MNNIEPKILVLDDEPLVLRAIQLQLERFDFEVETANHPTAAMDLLSAKKFDILICDNNMPFMSGIEFLKGIKDIYPNMLRFMLTGSAPTDEAGSNELKSLSVVEIFRKPCKVVQIVSSIHAALQSNDTE